MMGSGTQVFDFLLHIIGHRFTLKRQDAKDDPQPKTMGSFGKGQCRRPIEHRLCDHELRACRCFPAQKIDLRFQWVAVRIADYSRKQSGKGFQKPFTLPCVTAVEVGDYSQETKRVDIMYWSRTPATILGQGIATQRDDRFDTQSAGAKQIRLEREAVAVTAGEIQSNRYAQALLDNRGEYQPRHFDPAQSIVGQIDHISRASIPPSRSRRRTLRRSKNSSKSLLTRCAPLTGRKKKSCNRVTVKRRE